MMAWHIPLAWSFKWSDEIYMFNVCFQNQRPGILALSLDGKFDPDNIAEKNNNLIHKTFQPPIGRIVL